MNKIKTLIVDDEPANVKVLISIINDFCPSLTIVGTASNISDAQIQINSLEPELVLLDIEMPNGNGFDLLQKIPAINFSVIFITAFNHYAIKAIKYSAVDYLLKPVNIDELRNAVEKVTHQIHKKQMNLRVENLLYNLHLQPKQIQRITIPTHDGFVFEDTDNIMYLQASSNYTTIFTSKKYKITAARTVKDFEDMLPKNIFCRVHNSYIVNIGFVTKFQRQGRAGNIVMQDGIEIEVSVRKKDEFLTIINQFDK